MARPALSRLKKRSGVSEYTHAFQHGEAANGDSAMSNGIGTAS